MIRDEEAESRELNSVGAFSKLTKAVDAGDADVGPGHVQAEGGGLVGRGELDGGGGAFVFGAICASASFIDAPAACRASLPEANPGIYLTSSLGVTLPFNLLFGLPLALEPPA